MRALGCVAVTRHLIAARHARMPGCSRTSVCDTITMPRMTDKEARCDLTAEEIKIVEQDPKEPASLYDADDETALERNGAAEPYPPQDAGTGEEMDRLNARRIQLVERKANGLLTPQEKTELEHLQETFF